jgi:hypothetical protein
MTAWSNAAMTPTPTPSPRLTHDQLVLSLQAAREALARLRATLAETAKPSAPPKN